MIERPSKIFEGIVGMAQTMLRIRGEWQGKATSYEHIDIAVNAIADLIPFATRDLCDAAVSELKLRALLDEKAP